MRENARHLLLIEQHSLPSDVSGEVEEGIGRNTAGKRPTKREPGRQGSEQHGGKTILGKNVPDWGMWNDFVLYSG